MDHQPNNPLHGITLKAVVTELVDHYGFERLSQRVRIKCFSENPSIQSSLKFLRKTPWAREKVEYLYIRTFTDKKPARPDTKRPAPRKTEPAATNKAKQVFDWNSRSVKAVDK